MNLITWPLVSFSATKSSGRGGWIKPFVHMKDYITARSQVTDGASNEHFRCAVSLTSERWASLCKIAATVLVIIAFGSVSRPSAIRSNVNWFSCGRSYQGETVVMQDTSVWIPSTCSQSLLSSCDHLSYSTRQFRKNSSTLPCRNPDNPTIWYRGSELLRTATVEGKPSGTTRRTWQAKLSLAV